MMRFIKPKEIHNNLDNLELTFHNLVRSQKMAIYPPICYLLREASEDLLRPLLWFLFDFTLHKLFGRQPWHSIQREVPLLSWNPWNNVFEKSSRSNFDNKNVLFYDFPRNEISNKQIIKILPVHSLSIIKIYSMIIKHLSAKGVIYLRQNISLGGKKF